MNSRPWSAVCLAALLVCGLSAPAVAQPDVIVGEITGPSNYTADATYDAFSLGTTSCNVGTQVLTWIASTNQHPVIGGGLYKIENGRFLHIGRSWLKHGFTALQGTVCGPCTANPNGSALGVGCSDPYGSGLNGNQGPLGPRSQVNASNGFFPYPPANPSYSGATARRLKVRISDLDTSPGIQYVAEAQYIQPEDAVAGVDNNNASYRLCNLTGGPTNFSLAYSGSTQRMLPAIRAWEAADPGVIIQTVEVPGADGGQFLVGVKKTELPSGMFHFEYAVHNLNCHDSMGTFEVTFPNGTSFANAGMHSTPYNDGDGATPGVNYDNNSWAPVTASNGIMFGVDQPFAMNPNSNACRWASTFSFWFDADADPTGAVIGLYRSGGTQMVPAPSFPQPSWATNNAGASLDFDGATNDGFVGPIQVEVAATTTTNMNIGGVAGSPYEVFAALTPGIASNYVTPGGKIVNIDFADASFTGLFGPSLPTMPMGGLTLPIATPNANLFFSLQGVVVNPMDPEGFSLTALNELTIATVPRVVVEAVGSNSFNADTTSGFWRVVHNGLDSANVTSVTLDFSGAGGAAAGKYFDTDQGQMNGVFVQGSTYRNGSDVAAGLDYSVSSPFAISGWIGTNQVGTSTASVATVQFQFTGSQFNGLVFEFDADTDGGGPNNTGGDMAGCQVQVVLDDGTMASGVMTVDSGNPQRSAFNVQ